MTDNMIERYEMIQQEIKSNNIEEEEEEEEEEENEEKSRSPMLIGIYFTIWRITTVNLVEQYFGVKGLLCLSWEGTKNEYEAYELTKKEKTTNKWRPKFDPLNILTILNGSISDCVLYGFNVVKGDGKFDLTGKMLKGVRYPYIIIAIYNYNGVLGEEFELQSFPFDCQDLQIKFRSLCIDDYCLVPTLWKGGNSLGLLTATGHNLDEYSVSDYLLDIYVSKEAVQKGSNIVPRTESVAIFRVKLARKWQIFFWKIGLFMFVTSLCSLVVFVIENDSDLLADKFSLLITLLLTAVAFQFVVSTYIPNVSYNTYLDWYITVSFIIIFVVTILIAFVEIWSISDDVYNIIGVVSLIIFILIQCIFIFIAIYIRNYETKKLTMHYWDFYNKKYEKPMEKNIIPLSCERNIEIDQQLKKYIDVAKFDDIQNFGQLD